LYIAAALHQYRREPLKVQEYVEALMALSTEYVSPDRVARGTIRRGWTLVEQGQDEEGMAQMRQGLAIMQRIGSEVAQPIFFALLAEAYGKVGQCTEGLMVLAEAFALVDKNEERYFEAELYRLKGELLWSQDHHCETQSELCFRQALDVSRGQQAKSLELRAAMSLARLWQQQGKHQEARELLAPVYGWFTEGFDTADLQEAKALLEALTAEPAKSEAE